MLSVHIRNQEGGRRASGTLELVMNAAEHIEQQVACARCYATYPILAVRGHRRLSSSSC